MPAMVAPPYGSKQPYRAKAEALASSDAVALALHRLSVESRPAASSALTLQPSAHNNELTKLLRMLSRNHRLLFSLVAGVLLWRAARIALKRRVRSQMLAAKPLHSLCAACARSVVPTVPLTPVTEEALSDSADVPAASAAARCEVCVEAESRERLLLSRAAGACGSAAVLYLAWRASRPRRR